MNSSAASTPTRLKLKRKPLFDEEEVRKTLASIVECRSVFELRALDAQLSGHYRVGTVSGYFDNVDASINELGKLTIAKGIYVTLNPINSALLARRANRLDYAEKNATTNDQHILQRRWLLVDVDFDRPSGISASDDEKEAAQGKAREIYDYLKGRGWPRPIVADSGNGFHLLYRVDQPCEDDGLLEKVLGVLADRFNGDGVKLDRSVHNPARIARLYGTLAAKGDSTKERPHRLSKILKAPLLVKVSAEQLHKLVGELQPKDAKPVKPLLKRNSVFDVDGFLSSYGIEVAERITEPNGTIKWQLAHCPFNHDHLNGEAAVFQYPDGRLGFHCFHNSCAGKHWKDFRRYFEPERETPPHVEVQPAGTVEPVELPPAPALYVPPPLALLPSILQEYTHAAAESLNVDVAFILLPLLSSLGAAIGDSRSILLKQGFAQPPVVWSGIIARSGGRKSPSEQEGCFPIMAHERELMQLNNEAAEIYAEELSQWESKRGKNRGAEPKKPSFLTCACDDLTIEVLADILSQNPRGILVRKDELSHWLASFDQYKNARGSDVSRWLSLHTAVSLAVDRRTDSRHYRIINPRVSITGGIQPKILRRALTREFFERGLPARFVFAYPPFRKDKWSEATVPDDLRARVLDLFSELWLLQPNDGNPRLLPLDRDAKGEFVEFYNECGEAALEVSEHEEAVWGKLTGYGARFALIGQLAHNPRTEAVTGAIMQAACDLARWSGKESARIYDALAETQEQREQRELVEFIKRRGGSVYEREVMQSFPPLKNDKKGTERELTRLVKAGIGKWEPVNHGGGPGRPARKFQLLRSSTSTQLGISRGKTRNCVDVDTYRDQEITPATSPDGEPAGVSVPLLITRQMEAELLRRGLTQSEIDKLTPQQAHEILAAPAAPVASIVRDEFGVGRL